MEAGHTCLDKCYRTDKEKQAVAVALSLPEGDSRKIKEKVYDDLEIEDLT